MNRNQILITIGAVAAALALGIVLTLALTGGDSTDEIATNGTRPTLPATTVAPVTSPPTTVAPTTAPTKPPTTPPTVIVIPPVTEAPTVPPTVVPTAPPTAPPTVPPTTTAPHTDPGISDTEIRLAVIADSPDSVAGVQAWATSANKKGVGGRKIVRDPAFTSEPFGVYTRWIETEFVNDIEPWSGELVDGVPPAPRHSVVVEVDGKRVAVSLPSRLLPGSGGPSLVAAPRRRTGSLVSTVTGDSVKAPMQATVVKIAVEEGERVVKGDLVLVLEAMKMEQPITAHKDGTVAGINAAVGSTVASGHLLLNITS